MSGAELNAVDFFLVILALAYFIIVVGIWRYSTRSFRDKFNPLNILCFFSVFDSLSLLWFAVNPALREQFVYSQISVSAYKSDAVVSASYGVSLLGFACVAMGIISVMSRKAACKIAVELSAPARRVLVFGLSIWVVGLALTTHGVLSRGGLVEMWSSYILLGREPEISGYYMLLANAFITIGAAIVYAEFSTSRLYGLALLVVLMSVVALSVFGNRSPSLILLMMILFTHNFKVRRLSSIVNRVTIAAAACFLMLAMAVVNLRPGAASYLLTDSTSMVERLTRDVVLRVGSLERKMVVIGYYNANDILYGANYYSFLVAALPRSMFNEKPPVDTGVYLKAIAEGGRPTVNSSVETLPETSWPEGNLSGWMSFHLPGFLFLSLFSGAVFGIIYNYMKVLDAPYSLIFLFAMAGYWGYPSLSPFGLVRLLSATAVVVLLVFIARMFFLRRAVV